MSAPLTELAALQGDIEAMGSLPLLPLEDYFDYSRLCRRVLAVASEVAAKARAVEDAEAVGKHLYELGLSMRRAGDSLAGAEVLECAGRFGEATGDVHRSCSSYNSAGITLYQVGVFDRAHEMFDRAFATLRDDDFGRVRRLGVGLNAANILHYERRFEEAELAYLDLYSRVDATPPELYERHSTFRHGELLGFLAVNVAGNRCEWAQRDAEAGLPVGEHTAIATERLREGLARPIKPFVRMTAQCFRAHVLILDGQADVAEGLLEQVAEACAADRELNVLLSQVYRYLAAARRALGETERALVDCYRALECSLTVANDLEERAVVDTFVDVLRLSSQCLFDPSDAAESRARKFASRGGVLVGSLVDFLERKDWYTGHSHSRAVATLATRLGRLISESGGAHAERLAAEGDEDTLWLAATLHDIGKLELPWSLLNKIVPLKPWEREMLKSHAALGERILERVGLPEIGAVTAEHHETPAGTGYPRGTRTISLMGSLVAVADAFEAMTSISRSYRKPKTLDEAVREVAAGSGAQFDPTAASALVALFSHKL
jgi:HD-GYP domain-containing protein (c-di-GMP phosphodiesterase class II)